MTHRLYPETCLERWQRRKREEAAHRALEGMLHPIRPSYREEEHRQTSRDRKRHEEPHRRPSSDDDTPISNPFAMPSYEPPAASYEPPAPSPMPDPPSSSIDPGGGSSGGGGASGDW